MVVPRALSQVNPPPPCLGPVEVVIGKDGSASIASEAKKYGIEVEAINASMGPGGLGVGIDPLTGSRALLYQFSTQGEGYYIPKGSTLALSGDLAGLTAANSADPAIDGGTDIEEFITSATQYFVAAEAAGQLRPGVPKVILLFTDGIQNAPGDPVAAAARARALGIRTVVVAIGNLAPRNVLERIAGNPLDVIEVDLDFSDIENFLAKLKWRVLCPGSDTPPPTPTPPGNGGTPTATPTPSPIPGGGGTPTPTPTPGDPTAITLLSFSAQRIENGSLLVRWTTGTEVGTSGFEIAYGYRGQDPRVVSSRILARGSSSLGASYEVSLQSVPQGDELVWLVEIETDGDRLVYGPTVAGWPQLKGEVDNNYLPLITR